MIKTISFAALHFSVAFSVAYVITGSILAKMFIEADVPGDPFEVSDADTMLAAIAPNASAPLDVVVFSRDGCPYCVKADFNHTIAIHPSSAEELVTMKTPDNNESCHDIQDEGIEWKEAC